MTTTRRAHLRRDPRTGRITPVHAHQVATRPASAHQTRNTDTLRALANQLAEPEPDPNDVNLEDLTPKEIDGVLADTMMAHTRATLHLGWLNRKPGPLTQSDEQDKASLTTQVEQHQAVVADLDSEFRRRGGWSRWYLVQNTGGHIHTSTDCTTCFPDTVFAMLTDHSGDPSDHLVAEHGETVCTVCVPDAPAMEGWGNSRADRDREAARAEREAARAAREAERTAKAISNPDGTPLRDVLDGRLNTLSAARAAYKNYSVEVLTIPESNAGNRARYESARTRIGEAIAAKTGMTVEELDAEFAPKVLAAVRKQYADVIVWWSSQTDDLDSKYREIAANIRDWATRSGNDAESEVLRAFKRAGATPPD